MKITPLLLIFSIFVLSCSAPTSETQKEPDLSLIIQDSIQVNYTGLLMLMDVSPKHEKILLFDPQTRKFVVAGMDGSIQSEFVKERDAPDSFGSYPLAAGKYNDSGNIQIVSFLGIFEFNNSGEMVSNIRIPKDEQVSFAGRFDALSEIAFLKDKILLAGLEARGKYNKTQPEFYDNFLQLIWADPKTGKFERFLTLDPESIFQNDMSHEPSTLSTKFEVFDNQLYVISGTDPYLNIYELDSPYTKIERIPLNLTNYRLNEGEDPKKADPRAISYDPSFGNIQKMAKVNDLLFISYVNGYDDLDSEAYQNLQTEEDWQDFNSRISKKYKNQFLVLDLEGNKIAEFESPNQLGNVFVSREGSLWFISKPNTEVEEDFVKIYQVKIK